MKPNKHIALSIIISAALYAVFRSWAMSMGAFIGGALVDIDHLADYLMERGMPRSPRSFFSHFYERRHARLVLALHGWEWFIVLGAAGIATGWNAWVTGLLVGYAHHMATDTAVNGLMPRAYSFLWRMRRGFTAGDCFKKIALERRKGQ